ncbi:MAG: hypothetical protein ACYTG0_00955 [Planctomycetota bacterium]|jgi:hypothetical protein
MKSDKFNADLCREMRDFSETPIRIARVPYQEFTRWMDGQLEELVARWAHLAAPNAARCPRFRFRTPRP